MSAEYVLALDQGTTSSRAMLFRRDGSVAGSATHELEQIYPAPGHVEYRPQAIVDTQVTAAREVLARSGVHPRQVAAVGIANQRETTIVWERSTGNPVANAVGWQSRITAEDCELLKASGLEQLVRERTGLPIDPYFSATKIRYILDSDRALRRRAQRGELLFGTVDTYLAWQLTGGRLHVTDHSNASRTLLFNIHDLDWDETLLEQFEVPVEMLPEVRSSSEVYGHLAPELLGAELPLAALAGDQQAATFGQACFDVGTAKQTYGTGCFLMVNIGDRPIMSRNALVTTVGWVIDGKPTYCLEGSIFVGGAAVQWLRDGLRAIANSADVEELAGRVDDSGGVYFVPAFVGLGAPHWDPYARGLIIGITRGTTIEHVARAAVDSIAYQTRDLVDAIQRDTGDTLKRLKVDGGAAVNDRLLQLQADLLGIPVERPSTVETTALGAAYLAGLAVGFWSDQADVRSNWRLDRRFMPRTNRGDMQPLLAGWDRAVGRALNWELAPGAYRGSDKSAPSQGSDASRDLVRRFYAEAVSGGNLDALEELMAPDFTEHPPIGMPAPPAGRAGFKRFITALRAGFPDFEWTVEDWIVAGDMVVARGRGRGTHHGEFMGIPPTGRSVEWSAIHIFRIRDGRLTDRWGEANIGGLHERLREE